MEPVPGSQYLGEGLCRFCVWAPEARSVQVHILSPREQVLPLGKDDSGYWCAAAREAPPGSLYRYRLNKEVERPDPASRFQPQGVHGPSQVISNTFAWNDASWFGLLLADYIIYELHVGTFSHEGTFDGIIPHLDRLKELGVTAIELMPVAQFPGGRNWGYDGAYPFAVQNTYGGPEALKRLVNACHGLGLAVVLDVVYNHLGPEGTYLQDFGPYFTDRYRTFWGAAINFDGPFSDDVRHFFIQNAIYWVEDFHIDALRLDACHVIMDFSARTFLEELGRAVHRKAAELNRRVWLIAESDSNDPRLVRSPKLGGYGLDAVWSDDFHHALHALITGEQDGYYQDYGDVSSLARAFNNGFACSGQYSRFRRRRHGSDPGYLPSDKFVVFAQNHDQVGNRMLGERLSSLADFESLKLAAASVQMAPFIPLIFMGEEYGETAPFLYFIDHGDESLANAAAEGRRREFNRAGWDAPDPALDSTFTSSRLSRPAGKPNRVLFEYYRELIRQRNEVIRPAAERIPVNAVAFDRQKVLFLYLSTDSIPGFAVYNFQDAPVRLTLPIPEGGWRKVMDSAEARWLGPGSRLGERLSSEGESALELNPRAFALFRREF